MTESMESLLLVLTARLKLSVLLAPMEVLLAFPTLCQISQLSRHILPLPINPGELNAYPFTQQPSWQVQFPGSSSSYDYE